MKNDTVINLPKSIKVFKVGLGWDTKVDVDCSVITMDKKGNCIESIYFGYLKSRDGAIQHSGDNRNGKGAGDDETVTINLDAISKNVDSIWPVVTVFTYNKHFDDVQGAYCRIYDMESDQEFCRFSLSKCVDYCSNGCIIGSFQKTKHDNWMFKARGYYTKDTKSTARIKKYIRNIMNNNMEGIKIGEKGQYIKSSNTFNGKDLCCEGCNI